MSEIYTTIRNASKGDLKAFAIVVDRFKNMAFAYSYSKLGDFYLAEDATQEAFLEAFLKIKNLRYPEAFSNWFKKIVHKHCDRIWRNKKLQVDKIEISTSMNFNNSYIDKTVNDEVHSTLGSLPPMYRTVISLFHIEEYSLKEISDFLCLPVTTVKKRLLIARSKLKEIIMENIDYTLHSSALDARFSNKLILELRKRPNLMQIKGNSLHRIKRIIREALPEYEAIKSKELIKRNIVVNKWSLQFAFSPNKHDVLCTDLLDVTLGELAQRKKPTKILTFGREFYHKAEHLNNEPITHAFSLLCVGSEVTDSMLHETVQRITDCFFKNAELKYENWNFGIFDPCLRVNAKLNGIFNPIIGCGMFSTDLLKKLGLNADNAKGFAIEFSLENMILLENSANSKAA